MVYTPTLSSYILVLGKVMRSEHYFSINSNDSSVQVVVGK
jgi:hypothetical protein